WTGMLILAPIVGGAAVLAVGGLAARLIGPRWAPVAALLMALAWPTLHVSQAAYSEPLAILLLVGGLCLLTDVLIGTTRRRRPRTPAGPIPTSCMGRAASTTRHCASTRSRPGSSWPA